MNTACIVVSVDELWLLQRFIRHEMAEQDRWHFPPVSVDLNDQIADALRLTKKNGLTDAALVLTRGDCLAIDYCVPSEAKTPAGVPIGRDLLLKTYSARYLIDNGDELTAAEPPQLSHQEIEEAITHMEKE